MATSFIESVNVTKSPAHPPQWLPIPKWRNILSHSVALGLARQVPFEL
jgi:hypothetical protein